MSMEKNGYNPQGTYYSRLETKSRLFCISLKLSNLCKIYLFFGIKVQIFFTMNFGALGFGTKTEGYLELEVMEPQTKVEP
jgi:hypothetical protein